MPNGPLILDCGILYGDKKVMGEVVPVHAMQEWRCGSTHS